MSCSTWLFPGISFRPVGLSLQVGCMTFENFMYPTVLSQVLDFQSWPVDDVKVRARSTKLDR